MTLKFRNGFFVALFAIFSSISAFLYIFFFVALFSSGISFPDFFRFPPWVSKIPFMPFNSVAMFISVFALSFYAIACIAVIVSNFEKTNCIEVVLFSGFLISCFLETLRLVPPAFGIWRPLDGPILLCTRAILAGRLFAPVTFVCAAIMKDETLTQDIGTKYMLAALAAALVSAMIPVDSTKFTSVMLCFWGFSKTLLLIRILLFISAILSFVIETRKNGEEGLFNIHIWFTIMFSGYAILTTSDNFLFFAIGIATLTFGTIKYLRTIHQNYLWS